MNMLKNESIKSLKLSTFTVISILFIYRVVGVTYPVAAMYSCGVYFCLLLVTLFWVCPQPSWS